MLRVRSVLIWAQSGVNSLVSLSPQLCVLDNLVNLYLGDGKVDLPELEDMSSCQLETPLEKKVVLTHSHTHTRPVSPCFL